MKTHSSDPVWVRFVLVGGALLYLTLFLFLPIVYIFAGAIKKGASVYLAAWADPMAVAAIRLTLVAAGVAVLLNTIFGVAAAWALSKFEFKGKNVLTTLIDLPFTVSPVISGMIYALLFGAQSAIGPWLSEHGVRILFAPPSIILATIFVTFPFVVRELTPIMKAQGSEEEEAASTLGASGLQTFWRVTLPNIKWGLLYGIILCNARAVGEFGAVSVVSGHIRGKTNTLPLHVEILYNEYQFAAAFAVSTLFVFLAFGTVAAKKILENRFDREKVRVRS